MYAIFTNDEKLVEAAKKNGDKVICPNSKFDCLVDANLSRLVTSFLVKTLNIPTHLSGYPYIQAIIIKSLETPGFEKEKITKVVYPYCAKMFDTTTTAVERDIRHSIEVSFKKTKPEVYYELFGETRIAPSNKCFINSVVTYFKENYLN